MYGLVNKAVQDLVVTQFGADKWREIKQKAGVGVAAFVSMDPYPDQVTYGLVAAASEVLDLPPEKVLEAFGEYWTVYTAREGYGEMLSLAGKSFVEFLQNLDSLHARVGLSFPQLTPPSFRCSDVTDGSLRLHYYSSRRGLAPLVVGLIRGVGRLFDTSVEVALDKAREDGHDHDEFLVRYKPA